MREQQKKESRTTRLWFCAMVEPQVDMIFVGRFILGKPNVDVDAEYTLVDSGIGCNTRGMT